MTAPLQSEAGVSSDNRCVEHDSTQADRGNQREQFLDDILHDLFLPFVFGRHGGIADWFAGLARKVTEPFTAPHFRLNQHGQRAFASKTRPPGFGGDGGHALLAVLAAYWNLRASWHSAEFRHAPCFGGWRRRLATKGPGCLGEAPAAWFKAA